MSGAMKGLWIAGVVIVEIIIVVVAALIFFRPEKPPTPPSSPPLAEATPQAQVLAFIQEDEAWEKCKVPPGQSLAQQVQAMPDDLSDPSAPANRLLAVMERRFEVPPDPSTFIAGSPPRHQAEAERITSTSTNGDEAVITTHLDSKQEGGIDYRYTLHRGAGGWLITTIDLTYTKLEGSPAAPGQ
jgi:hypothetical protein